MSLASHCPCLAGYTIGELIDAKFKLVELKAQAGFTAREFKDCGCELSKLGKKGLDFPLADLKAAGFTALELKNDGCELGELVAVPFSGDVLLQLTTPSDNPVKRMAELRDASASALQMKEAQCEVKHLKRWRCEHGDFEARFAVTELKNANFSARDLKLAGAAVALSPGAYRVHAILRFKGSRTAFSFLCSISRLSLL